MDFPLVSVIMNGFNAAPFLREAIDSVFAQTYENWEIVFWDNQSTDDTAQIAKTFTDRRFIYFKASQFTPLGAARNSALRHASGELIAFLDCDDIWLPNKLELQVPLFKNPKVGLVYSDTFFFNGKGDERRLYRAGLPGRGECFRHLLAKYFLSMETVIVRADALYAEPIWFDERFNMIEEADLFRRISRNWLIDAVDDALAKWRVHGDSWSYKFPHLLRQETVLMLNNYNVIEPDFSIIFADEIKKLMMGVELAEARRAWLEGKKWPLVRHLIKTRTIKGLTFALAVALWPASYAKFALSLRGEILI